LKKRKEEEEEEEFVLEYHLKVNRNESLFVSETRRKEYDDSL